MLAGSERLKAVPDLNSEKVLCGLCPDEQCRAKLFFPAHDPSIECTSCGQRHEQKALLEIAEVTNPEVALHNILRNILLGQHKPKMGPDSVKVLGLSNYQCKILSPLLTVYGMDKKTGHAKLLRGMGQGDVFDCGILGSRAFLIEPDHIEITGYGRDRTGSLNYLKDTLEAIKKSNNNQECLLPIHADGDGHCLVHALSKALIGRELFWHALRTNLKTHFQANQATYKSLFMDFIDKDEWHDIIEECDPDYIPSFGEPVGLRNIHIFGLANVLHRPIILLDSISGIQSSGDYTGVFLPVLLPVEKCSSKEGERNKPLCLAWSNKGHNHYIALVGVKGPPLPHLPGWMMPSPWGAPQEMMTKYLELDLEGGCTVGGSKCLGDKYVLRLVHAMEEVFFQNHGVSSALVADVHRYLYKAKGVVYAHPNIVIEDTKESVKQKHLFRCLTCEAIARQVITPESLLPGGYHYKLAMDTYKKLDPAVNYSFPLDGLICRYDAEKDELIPDKDRSRPPQCLLCQGTQLRQVRGEGSICYINGDRTTTRTSHSTCQCGFKHYWDGEEYDNLPKEFPVVLEWGDKAVMEKAVWFQNESDPARNSNVYTVAEKLVLKHFPGIFGSERLIQKVVDKILLQTAVLSVDEDMDDGGEGDGGGGDGSPRKPPEGATAWDGMTASKIILTGPAKQTLHKEELTKSETEKNLRQRIEEKAGQTQRRRTMEQAQQPSVLSPTKVNPKLQKTGGTPTPSTPAQQPPDHPPSTPSNVRKVRVSTSDGRQLQLTLEKTTTYAQLQAMLAAELGVPAERQRIRYGFPPRELCAPEAERQEEDVPLQHGDRIVLEVPAPTVPVPSAEVNLRGQAGRSPKDAQQGGIDVRLQQATNLLLSDKNLADMQSATTDIDTAISTLQIMASLTGKDLWESVQGMPKLFLPGGAYYEQFKRDFGLEGSHHKHCTFPTLPGKIFRYNAEADIIEICLEPEGHFPVFPGVEERARGPAATPVPQWTNKSHITDLSSLATQESTREALRTGSSGVVVNPTMRTPIVHVPFSGKGHVMRDSHEVASSPQGLTEKSQTDQQDSPDAMETTQLEPEAMVTSEDEAASCEFKRIGPGYTVLNPNAQNAANLKTDRVQLITKTVVAMAEILASVEDSGSPQQQESHVDQLDCDDSVLQDDTEQTAAEKADQEMAVESLPAASTEPVPTPEKTVSPELQSSEAVSSPLGDDPVTPPTESSRLKMEGVESKDSIQSNQ